MSITKKIAAGFVFFGLALRLGAIDASAKSPFGGMSGKMSSLGRSAMQSASRMSPSRMASKAGNFARSSNTMQKFAGHANNLKATTMNKFGKNGPQGMGQSLRN